MRRARMQAVALRAIADRVAIEETPLSEELAHALASEFERRPELAEELETFVALDEGTTPDWHVRELERCEQQDSGGDTWAVVRNRILARAQRSA